MILWSRYKGSVFSHVCEQGAASGLTFSFVQVAETEQARVKLGGVDLSYHRYPYRLLFKGAYEQRSSVRIAAALCRDLLLHPTELVVLPGYHRFECWAMLLLCVILRRKRAVFCDSTALDRPREGWRETAKSIFFKNCQGAFCYGVRSKEYAMRYGLLESQIFTDCQAAALPHGYDAGEVLRSYSKQDNSAYPLSFLFLGRLAPEKGLVDLLLAFQACLMTFPEALLTLVGAGPQEQHLMNAARQMKIEKSVKFIGPKGIDDLAAVFTRSTALVLPSHSEPWGLAVNESLSYGCPVVVSDACGCVPELVVEGITGFSFPVGDHAAMADRMMRCVDMTPARVEVARQCLKLISQFTPERAAGRIVQGCMQILAN